MKSKKISGFLLIIGFMAAITCGCKKYDEGGLIRKTEKNLKTSWKLEKYLRNSTDETVLLLISNYEETYSDDEKYSRYYIDKDGNSKSETGTWKFDKEQKKLNISGVGSIEITDITGTVSSSYFNILKLETNEFWYYYTNGSDKHEFHLVKK